MEIPEVFAQAHRAFHADDAAAVRDLLQSSAELRARINDPAGDFGSPPIVNVRSKAMLDLLIEYGADINAKSKWWAGGFNVLQSAPLEVAQYAVSRGATIDVHGAARLGLIDRLRELVTADPDLVHARGGDGQTPLHFAANEEIATFLLENGADIDARDIDHQSTPAQWMLGDRLELARFLVRRGASADLLMGGALGDLELARKQLDADPNAIRIRVSEEYFPMVGGKGGGTIYQWTLGWHVSPHQVAKARAHEELFRFLWEQSPLEVRLVNAAWLHDEATLDGLLSNNPNPNFTPAELRQTAHAARNDDATALRLLLKAGVPSNARGQHNATPLHWACWHGNAEAVKLLLPLRPDLEDSNNDYSSTPLGWAMHGSENGWHHERGNYPTTVEALLRAGVKRPDRISGTPEVKAAIEKFFLTSI
ncbi:MAG TPA: ankyrin repeat domain-containing protein [Verrucomicrobiae bacterium]